MSYTTQKDNFKLILKKNGITCFLHSILIPDNNTNEMPCQFSRRINHIEIQNWFLENGLNTKVEKELKKRTHSRLVCHQLGNELSETTFEKLTGIKRKEKQL